jgi:hypothetical protein
MWKHRLKEYVWTKELDDKLLLAISQYKNCFELAVMFNVSYPTILRRIKEMGFDGLIDARKVMTDD